jgi:hypothetical protein
MTNDMRWLPTSAPIDLSEWTWCNPYRDAPELVKVIDAAIGKAVAETLTSVLKEHPPQLSLPIGGDGYYGPVNDPATIYLHLPFDKTSDGEHVYQVPLAEVIAFEFWSEHVWEDWETEKYEPSEGARALAVRLRELADLLERGPDNWGMTQPTARRPAGDDAPTSTRNGSNRADAAATR